MTAPNPIPASYSTDPADVTTGPQGQRAHRLAVDHTSRLERRLWTVRPGVWCMVGNGLSNQTFVEGPDGIIAIDTGESTQEMAEALGELREHTTAPLAAVMYTHFHYVAGTTAVFDDAGGELPVWGHRRIVRNLERYGFEVGAAAGRGLVHQFGLQLPAEGEDGLVNVGLGLHFRNPDHAPFTNGFVPPTREISEPQQASVAGLDVVFTPAPSDADDNVTIWFPTLGVCVNNHVWPALFNVYAIRGEEYRDPRVLLTGLDHILSLGAEHLVGAHGPPISGVAEIAEAVTAYRDSIQYLWDQTVRGLNRGLTTDELTRFVQLPPHCADSYLTQQLYGLAEHHVRQIHAGLRGWFDGDEAKLLPLPPADRCRRLIQGFGGVDEVRRQTRAALDELDLRWAVELASWLVHADADPVGADDAGEDADRSLLAEALRAVGQRTTAANIRNWCLTRALELEGTIDLRRHRTHRFSAGAVIGNPPDVSVRALRVLVVPERALANEHEIRLEFAQGTTTGLRLRNGVAVPTDGTAADLVVQLELTVWADILANRTTLQSELDVGRVVTDDIDGVRAFFACFDHGGLGGS